MNESHRITRPRAMAAALVIIMAFVSSALAAEPLYSGESLTNMQIRAEQDRQAESVGYYSTDDTVQILAYEPQWLRVRQSEAEGWVLRHLVNVTKQLEPSVLPYGALKSRHAAALIYDAPLYAAPSTSSPTLMNLPQGARVAILSINDGWAKVAYFRQYGYVYMAHMKDMEPVMPEAVAAKPGQLISAFVTAYSTDESQLNVGRMNNIKVACDYIQGYMMEPGEELSFNKWLGPYSGLRGYMEAPILINGTTMPGYGGGTCQVSTTMYNALLTLKGMKIVYRRAHGPAGAAYVAHGVDAAVGNASLDLVFRNEYDFPIMFDTWAGRGILYIGIYRAQ